MCASLESNVISRKTVTRTIRIDDGINRLLEDLADKERVSVNLIITKTLRKFVEWDVYAQKFGFTALPGSLLSRMMECISEEKVKELGRWTGTNIGKEYLLFRFKNINLQNTLLTLQMLGSEYAKAFQFEHSRDGPRHTLVLKHGMGRHWSIFWKELLEAMFSFIPGTQIRVELTENQTVAEISPA